MCYLALSFCVHTPVKDILVGIALHDKQLYKQKLVTPPEGGEVQLTL